MTLKDTSFSVDDDVPPSQGHHINIDTMTTTTKTKLSVVNLLAALPIHLHSTMQTFYINFSTFYMKRVGPNLCER